MKRYTVIVEVRQQGAIGIFERRHYVVEAESADAAVSAAGSKARADGWETRFVMVVGIHS
jgi:hypothetical protein